MTRSEAWSLLEEFVEARGLRRHMLAVESAMRRYAEGLGGPTLLTPERAGAAIKRRDTFEAQGTQRA